MKALKRLWASGDRYTEWGRKYQLSHPDGTIETYVVECTRLAHPRRDQFMRRDVCIDVIPRKRQLVDRATGKPIKPRSRYWSFSQSFHGGPAAAGDGLGGFNTGRFVEVVTLSRFNKAIREMLKVGFEVVQSY
ncbi:hypothetical protein LCGC14_1768780 [marine sediment metagenome]|uniref:Uncharacterized protein n=1 Tax=marine sediment metagenome TaxID=412755 RepID=A0A0F9JYJ3_9ZZZZ